MEKTEKSVIFLKTQQCFHTKSVTPVVITHTGLNPDTSFHLRGHEQSKAGYLIGHLRNTGSTWSKKIKFL